MDFNLFVSEIIDALKEIFPETEIVKRVVAKNNDVTYTGVSFNELLENGNKIGTTIYLDELFKRYQNGLSFGSAVDKVVSTYMENAGSKAELDLDFSFEKVKDRIIFNLVNAKKNEKILEDAVCMDYLDLKIVFRVLANKPGEDCLASFILPKHLLSTWGKSIDEIKELAFENLKRLFPPVFERIEKLVPLPKEVKEKGSFSGVYVLTNSLANYGASTMVYDDSISNFARKTDRDMFVIPSSIHEVICVPSGNDDMKDYIRGLISQVNRECVQPEDFLSNTLYICDKESGEIKVA